MKRILPLLFATGLAACGGDPEAEPAAPAAETAAPPPEDPYGDPPEPKPAVITGFETPESALHDAVGGAYLVSNIHGDPFARDGNGFVSRLPTDGSAPAMRWIDGAADGVELDAPKGMAIRGDELFVADLSVVRRFDRASGEPLGTIEVPGATFLNDVAVGEGGVVYVTDSGFAPGFEPSGTDAVWQIGADGVPQVVVRGADLGHPNGIATHGADVFIVTWGGGVFGLVGREESGGLLTEVALPAKQLDGLVRAGEGEWLISSWEAKCVYRLRPTGESEVVFADLEAPADIGFDEQRGLVLIPLFTRGELATRTYRPAAK